MQDINKGEVTKQAVLVSEHNSKNAWLLRDKRRPITVLNLPTDILCSIFDYFQDANAIAYGKLKWRVKWRYGRRRDNDGTNHRQTIQSARLACRLFHQLASPLLCPILQVQLSQASLNRIDNISRSPLIAAGVRGIQVVLEYRPRELAEDLSRFKDYRKKDLDSISSRCEYLCRDVVYRRLR